MAMDPSEQLVPLGSGGGDWALWRWAALRGTGFPVSTILQLADPEATRLADAVLDAEAAAAEARERLLAGLRSPDGTNALRNVRKRIAKGALPRREEIAGIADALFADAEAAHARIAELRAEYVAAHARAEGRGSKAVRHAAMDARFREALTWQNRSALALGVDLLLKSAEDDRTSAQRKRELAVVSYLQRYCTKNETIGFFGPVGWARWLPDGPAISVKPGPSLLARRDVHFEQWPIDALAAKLRRELPLEPWLRPRRFPFVRLDGDVAISAMTGKRELSRGEGAVLARADGIRAARAIARDLVTGGDFAREEDAFDAMRKLAEEKLLAFDLEVPLGWDPDRTLRALLETIDDDAVRADALTPLDELEAARERIERAAGDPEALGRALAELETTFTRLTGAPPTRNAGLMYAGRGIVYEECRRDIDVALGPALNEAIAPALSLLLDSARWVVAETTRVYRRALDEMFETIAKRKATHSVPFADYWLATQRLFHGTDRLVDRVSDELTSRWWKILGEPDLAAKDLSFDPAALREAVREAFPAPNEAAYGARTHSPDLMIAASSAEDVAAGRFRVVLGEMHVGVNTLLSAALYQSHPHHDEIAVLREGDPALAHVAPVPSKDWPRATVRTLPLPSTTEHRLETGVDPAAGPRDRVLLMSDLVVERHDGALHVVRPADGVRIELMQFFEQVLGRITVDAYRLLPKHEGHSPRISFGRVIVARERWSLMPSELSFAFEKNAEDRFLAARRSARALGMPRFFFAKTPIETKPTFVDLDSPALVAAFSKIVRSAAEHASGPQPIAITEMIPGLDEAWLTDAEGGHYTSEIRIVAVDRR